MKSLKDKVYKILKEMIISGKLKYNERIEEELLASSLEVSRTPVREAINKLEQEGWINIVPRRGIFVSNVSLKEINDIFQVRINIEPTIVQMAFNNVPLHELKSLKEKFVNFLNRKLSSEEVKELDKLDNDLHLMILKSCDNNFLIKMMENVYEHNMRLRNQSIQADKRRTSATEEHIEIIDAVLEKDLDRALEITKVHIINSKEGFFNGMMR